MIAQQLNLYIKKENKPPRLNVQVYVDTSIHEGKQADRQTGKCLDNRRLNKGQVIIIVVVLYSIPFIHLTIQSFIYSFIHLSIELFMADCWSMRIVTTDH